ncbi:hypothetical protein HN615_15315 [Candidatus Woesearchaeota archaeon]|jgi:DNA gyrase subunit B|nr:hypothetical protein [Candidatus Woesearchaeota archaeon]
MSVLSVIRKRPTMFIGNTDDDTGLHRMVFEVVDNAINEASAGYCSKISITIHEDQSVSITDDGRGIPVDIYQKNISAAEVIMTVFHAGGIYDNRPYRISNGVYGIGLPVVNALSETVHLTICRNGKTYKQSYTLGVPDEPMKVTGTTDITGTTIHFKPSHDVFTITDFKYETLANRVRELSFLNSGVHIEIKELATGRKDVFEYENGITDFVKYLNKSKTSIRNDIIVISADYNDVTIDMALQWSDTSQESIYCFTNNIPQRNGGSHLAGFKRALTGVFDSYIESSNMTEKEKNLITSKDTSEGLTAIISIRAQNPKFSSQTKDKLVSPEVHTLVELAVNEKLGGYFLQNPNEAKIIVRNALKNPVRQ